MSVVIWIDREHAKIFNISSEKIERKNVQARHTDHHTHRFDQFDEAQHEKKFFSEVASHLLSTDRLLIVGPGVAKHHFQSHLVEQWPLLAKQVAGCETVDHPTDHQIAATAKRFFSLA